jgi:histidine kinase/DNA gyrase B/HSP90-like ATPase
VSDIALKLGFDVLRSYRRLAYTPWYALAEFIDNSTQSYIDNSKALNAAYKKDSTKLVVEITYDRTTGVITVRDNAMGMSFEDLEAAVHVGKPPAITTGRSQFGLGMKTAAGWFGDLWSVRTKKLGEKLGHKITVDVDKIIGQGTAVLPYESFKANPEDHFTEIKIERLHQILQGRRLGKTKEFLKSMYRVDSREGILTLKWQEETLKWDDKIVLLEDPQGKTWRRDIDFKVGKRRVVGWAGVLAPGSSGRSNAGFAIIRRGRLIRGWPEPWRPETIFGPFEGSNDLINQRVTGELRLDDFDVTHTKDDILFEDDEDDLVEDGIKSRIADVLEKARTFRQRPAPEPTSRRVTFGAAVSAAGLDVRASSIRKTVEALLKQKIKPDAVAAALGALASRAAKEETMMEVSLANNANLRVVVTDVLSEEAPYALIQSSSATEWLLVVNVAHPICEFSNGDAVAHFEHLLADSAALWVVQQQKREMTPSDWVLLKDAVLRAILEDE